MRTGLLLAAWLAVQTCGLANGAELTPPIPTAPAKRVRLASPKGSELKASLGTKMAVAAVVLPPPYQSAGWWGNTIAQDGDKHALVYSDWSPAVWAYVWYGDGPGRAFKLPGWTQLQCPATVLKDDTLVVADMTTANGGMRISTFHIGWTNATIEQNLVFSDLPTLCPSACLTPAGGVLVAAYQHDSSYNLLTAYRTPAGMWQNPSYREFVPGPVGISSIAIEMINGPDGRVWCVINRDSSHVIDLARYDEGQFYDFHQALLHAGGSGYGTNALGEMAPNGEFPDVRLARSGTNVLFTYQNYRQEWPCEFLYSWNVVTAIGADLVPHFVALNSNLVMEVFTPSPIFTTHDGFDLLSYELNEDCSQGPWTHRRFSKGTWIAPGPVSYGAGRPNDIAYSPDGFGFWRWPDFVPRLTKLPLTETRTVLSISRQGGNVTVSWTNAKEGDVLEASPNATTWADVGTANPVTLPMSGPKRFFRVRHL